MECTFKIKDTISNIVIGYSETTESLDAEIRKGTLYYPPKIFNQIKKLKNTGKIFPCGFDLYLKGEENLKAILFDTILSPKTENEYLVSGKVIGFKSYGVIFNVYSYKKI